MDTLILYCVSCLMLGLIWCTLFLSWAFSPVAAAAVIWWLQLVPEQVKERK